ncbi:MAG: EamA/RhaT family transporter, partial [Pseudolabrys sp.]|nr:EamA/RhaT family transporter [Pseudolabrys sp.]
MTEPVHDHRRERLTGIGLMLLTVLVFACLDATAKYLGTQMPTLQVVGVRCATAFLIAFLFSNPFNRPGLLRTGRPMLQFWRALMLLGSTMFNF